MVFLEVEKPRIRDLTGIFRPPVKASGPGSEILSNTKLVGSGKAAISLVLKYLTDKKVLANKLDEVLVADWIGYPVYNQIQPFAFPVKTISKKTKVIVIHHQCGYPQQIEKIASFAAENKLVVVEDCAHALYSHLDGKRLGSMGDFAVYSFSKWFFCYALGGVSSKYPDFSQFVDREISETPIGLGLYKDTIKMLHEESRFLNNTKVEKALSMFLLASYAVYGYALKPGRSAQNLMRSKINREIVIRKERYKHFLERTDGLGICDHLIREDVLPYMIPINVPEVKVVGLLESLRSNGFYCFRYHFDVNRNLLEPKFIPTVGIPCHGGMNDTQFSRMTDIIIGKMRQ